MIPNSSHDLAITLLTLPPPRLKAFLVSLLRDSTVSLGSFAYHIGDDYPARIISDLLIRSRDLGSRQTSAASLVSSIRRVVYSLTREWDPALRDLAYLKELYYTLALVGSPRLLPKDIYHDLLLVARTGRYKGIQGDDRGDLQLVALQALFVLSRDEQVLELAKIYVSNPRYSPICFRVLTENDLSAGPSYLQPLVDCAIANDAISLAAILERYYRMIGLERFKHEAIETYRLLTEPRRNIRGPRATDRWNTYLRALRELQISVEFINPETDFDVFVPDQAPAIHIVWNLRDNDADPVEFRHAPIENRLATELLRRRERQSHISLDIGDPFITPRQMLEMLEVA